jgi:hypothetical protein
MKKPIRGLVLVMVCGVGFMLHRDGWTAEAPPAADPVATLPEPVGDVLEDIAWVHATASHAVVPADTTYSLHDSPTGLGWAFPPRVREGFLEQGVDELYLAPPTRYVATPAYRAATEANAGRARVRVESEPYGELVEEVEGNLVPYTKEGLPFPDLSPADPQAAREIIHNFVETDRGGGRAALDFYVYVLGGGNGVLVHDQPVPSGFTPLWTDKAHGTVVRQLHMDMVYAQLERAPGTAELWKSRFDFSDPPEMTGNKMVAIRSLNPVERERGFMYLRETRKATAAALPRKYELFAGTHYPLDSFYGWEGHEYFWRFQLVGEVLVPTIVRSKHSHPYFTGQWGSIPDNTDNWELRRSFVVLAQSREPENMWPYRLLFFDQEMQLVNMALLYDKDGHFYGVHQSIYFQDASTGLPLPAGMVLRLRNKPEATVLFFHRERMCVTENTPAKLELFSPASLGGGESIRQYLASGGCLDRSAPGTTLTSTK